MYVGAGVSLYDVDNYLSGMNTTAFIRVEDRYYPLGDCNEEAPLTQEGAHQYLGKAVKAKEAEKKRRVEEAMELKERNLKEVEEMLAKKAEMARTREEQLKA